MSFLSYHNESSSSINHNKNDNYHLSYKNEIIQSFQVFDKERTGFISINDLKLLLRALGFRVTKLDVLRDVIASNKRRGIYYNNEKLKSTTHSSSFGNNDDSDEESYNSHDTTKDIELETVLDVILNPDSKYNRQNQSEDDINLMHKINFRLFDVDNKGYITASNVKRVIQEIQDFQNSNRDDAVVGVVGRQHLHNFDNVDDNELRAMIEEFDADQDGVINEKEFRKIMDNI